MLQLTFKMNVFCTIVCMHMKSEVIQINKPAIWFWFIAMSPFILISNKQRIYQSLICTKIPEQDTMKIQEQYRQNEAKHSGTIWKKGYLLYFFYFFP